ncbi:MAG TPA: hypothetical protein VMD77_11140 [Candidatus Baltobacteraceae bacterium]|nr:hypothetical protein [Candidatus Baltobacteraceae bacterium]
MRCSAKQFFGALAILFLAFPVWARPDKTYTAEWDNSQTTMIGNTQVKPGTYQVEARADQNTLEILRNGKVIAQTPCHWIQLPTKASDTEVDTNRNQIVQVEFQGKTEAVRLGS